MRLPWEKIDGSKRRENAIRCARKAYKQYGVPRWTAFCISFAAAFHGISQALAYAVCEQESGFRHVFGCDLGPTDGPPYCHQEVTKERYQRLRDYAIRMHIGNGVSLFQITYWTYLRDKRRLYKRHVNALFGCRLISRNVNSYGVRKGLAVYNGGAENPQYDYADSVLALKKKWRRRFA